MFSRSARAPYVCQQCLRQSRRRLYSSQTSNELAPPSPPPSGAAKLRDRRLISLHGPDASKFLQGLITANMQPEPTSGFYTAFLNASGRVLSDTFIYPTLGSKWHGEANKDKDAGFLVETDSRQASGLFKHLRKHKLRSKFQLRLLEDEELDVWSVWEEDERWTAHTKAGNENGVLGLTDCRAPGMGQRMLLTHRDLEGLRDVRRVSRDAYTVRRYLKGVAEGQAEIPGADSLPMNCNVDLMGGIDFKKGCYVGQELTIRTHHTGVVRRRVLPIRLYNHDQEPPERLAYEPTVFDPVLDPVLDTVVRRDDQRKRDTGKLIASIGNVGLAMCRLQQMSDLTVSSEGSTFSPRERFFVPDAEGNRIGVKAFVPDWIRGQVREPKIQKRVG